MIEPTYDKTGSYVLKTAKQREAALVATLRNILTCPSAYHSQGPDAIIEQMVTIARQTLRAVAPDDRFSF